MKEYNHIHTDVIGEHLVPALSPVRADMVYASEADILDVALFGMTAAEWRCADPDKDGNLRDQPTAAQLVCLANLENLNALFIREGLPQGEGLA